MRLRASLGLAALLGLSGCTTAQPPAIASVDVSKAIVRDAAETGQAVAGYAAFTNLGPTTAIVAAECSCAEQIELHVVRRDGGQVSMDTDWPLALPEGERVEIKPGSPRHLMLVGTTVPIAVDEEVIVRFRLQDGSWIEAPFVAVADSAAGWSAQETIAER